MMRGAPDVVDIARLTGISWARLGVAIGNLTYEYDAAGRKTAVGGSLARTGLPTAVASASHNAANRLTSWNGTTLTYDDNGNMTSDGSRSFTWNARDQMTGISGAATASFQYDAGGRRMQKTVAGSTTGYLYDGGNIVQEQGAGASNLVTGFGYDQFYARTDGSGTQVPLSDSLQSTVGMTDGAGGLGAQYTYEPYGSTTVVGSGGGSQQFTGRENDGTGLMYYRARYYAPGLGRFVSEDPLGFGGGDVNLYGYVGNSPISFTDSKGKLRLLRATISGAGIGAATGALSTGVATAVWTPRDLLSKKTLIAAGSNAVFGAATAAMAVQAPEITVGCVGILMGSAANFFEYFAGQRLTGDRENLQGLDWALKMGFLASLGTWIVASVFKLLVQPEAAAADGLSWAALFPWIELGLQVIGEIVDSTPNPFEETVP